MSEMSESVLQTSTEQEMERDGVLNEFMTALEHLQEQAGAQLMFQAYTSQPNGEKSAYVFSGKDEFAADISLKDGHMTVTPAQGCQYIPDAGIERGTSEAKLMFSFGDTESRLAFDSIPENIKNNVVREMNRAARDRRTDTLKIKAMQYNEKTKEMQIELADKKGKSIGILEGKRRGLHLVSGEHLPEETRLQKAEGQFEPETGQEPDRDDDWGSVRPETAEERAASEIDESLGDEYEWNPITPDSNTVKENDVPFDDVSLDENGEVPFEEAAAADEAGSFKDDQNTEPKNQSHDKAETNAESKMKEEKAMSSKEEKEQVVRDESLPEFDPKEVEEAANQTLGDIDDLEKTYASNDPKSKAEFEKLRQEVRHAEKGIRDQEYSDWKEANVNMADKVSIQAYNSYKEQMEERTNGILKDIDDMEKSGHVNPETQKQLEHIRRHVQELSRSGIDDMQKAMSAHVDTVKDDTGKQDPLHDADKKVERGYRDMADDKQKTMKTISFHSMKARAVGFSEMAVLNFANHSREALQEQAVRDAEKQVVQIKNLQEQIKQMETKIESRGRSWTGFKTLMTGRSYSESKPPRLYEKLMNARIQKAKMNIEKCRDQLQYDKDVSRDLAGKITRSVSVVEKFNDEHQIEQPNIVNEKLADAELRAKKASRLADEGEKAAKGVSKDTDAPVR